MCKLEFIFYQNMSNLRRVNFDMNSTWIQHEFDMNSTWSHFRDVLSWIEKQHVSTLKDIVINLCQKTNDCN